MLLLIIFVITNLFSATPNPFAEDNNSEDFVFVDEEVNNKEFNKLMFLDAIQKNFWYKSRKDSDNTLNIRYKAGHSYKVRTRANMTTTFILDNDKIALAQLGDNIGFELKELGVNRYDLSNILTIKPNLVGIDTNLTIIGESGNIYSFYLFSTDYKNTRNPTFLVFVSEYRSIGKIKIKDLDKEETNTKEKIEEEGQEKEVSNDDEIIIGDNVNKISIIKNEIKKGYIQYPKDKDSKFLEAKEIFNDNKWTYFKFDKNLATSKFPAIFRVVDGYDNPMNSRIVGDYLIVESISPKWTLRIGNSYVCVRLK